MSPGVTPVEGLSGSASDAIIDVIEGPAGVPKSPSNTGEIPMED